MTRPTVANATDAQLAVLEKHRAALVEAESFLTAHSMNVGRDTFDISQVQDFFASRGSRFHDLAVALQHRPEPSMHEVGNQDFLDALGLVLSARENPNLSVNDRETIIERVFDLHPQLRNVFNREGSDIDEELSPELAPRPEPPNDLIELMRNVANYMTRALDREIRLTRGEDVESVNPAEEQLYVQQLQLLRDKTQEYFLRHDFRYQQLIEDTLGTSVYELSLAEFGAAMWGMRQQVPVNSMELAHELGLNPSADSENRKRAAPTPLSMKPEPGPQ